MWDCERVCVWERVDGLVRQTIDLMSGGWAIIR